MAQNTATNMYSTAAHAKKKERQNDEQNVNESMVQARLGLIARL